MLPLSQAAKEVELVSRRLGLLHLAFARTIVDALGEDEGKALILQAIKFYGKLVGEEAKTAVEKQGLATTPQNFSAGSAKGLPDIGMHDRRETVVVDGQKRSRAYGCAMAKVWREYGEEELGSLYCFIDPAKFMYYNPAYKQIHTRTMPVNGGDCCELAVVPATDADRDAFFADKKDWTTVDKDIATKKE